MSRIISEIKYLSHVICYGGHYEKENGPSNCLYMVSAIMSPVENQLGALWLVAIKN